MATPTTSFFTPGPTSVFVPAASVQLQVEFSRNPASFPINQYIRLVPVEALAGLYPEMNAIDPVTVVTDLDHDWPEGQERPTGPARPMRWKRYDAARRTYPFQLGSLTVDQATFDVVATNARGEAARAMTDRSLRVATLLTTSANWPAANTAATVDALLSGSGLSWFSSSTTELTIKRSFGSIKQTILQQTGGVVTTGVLGCVLNPDAAEQMGRTQEIHQYLTQHEQAMTLLAMQDRKLLDDYGLPPWLYGIRMIVEDSVRQSTRRDEDASGTLGFTLADNKAIFISLKESDLGNIERNSAEAVSFNTVTGFVQEDMTVETEVDSWNRLTKGAITDTIDFKLSAPNSGFLVQDIST